MKKREVVIGNRDGVNGMNLTYQITHIWDPSSVLDSVTLYRRMIGEVVCHSRLRQKIVCESRTFPLLEVGFRLKRGWCRNLDEAANALPDTKRAVFEYDVDALTSFN